MQSSTHWGQELEGIEPAPPDSSQSPGPAPSLALAGHWAELLRVLRAEHDADAMAGVEPEELASAVLLSSQGDVHGAIARLHFSMGLSIRTKLRDALSTWLAQNTDDRRWRALAWMLHSEGEAKLRELIDSDHVDARWLAEDAGAELEDLVFDRADATADRGWRALSALLASQSLEEDIDEGMIFAHCEVGDPDNARAWAIRLQVLLALGYDEAAKSAEREVLELHDGDPQRLFAVLDAANAKEELAEIAGRLEQLGVPIAKLQVERKEHQVTAAQHSIGAAFEALRAFREGPAPIASVVDVVLPPAPRRTDEEWLERKAQGDAEFLAWVKRWAKIAMVVFTAGWLAVRLLSSS